MATMGWTLDAGKSEIVTDQGQRLELRPTSERRRGMCQIRPQGAEGAGARRGCAGSSGRHHRGARPEHQDSAPPSGLEDQGLEG